MQADMDRTLGLRKLVSTLLRVSKIPPPPRMCVREPIHKDAGVYYAPANPGNPLSYSTPPSAPPVSVLGYMSQEVQITS